MEDLPHAHISQALIKYPPIPVRINLFNVHDHKYEVFQSLTERELLNAHAEVTALQERYGLSYKDASHRLYHSEIAKVLVLEHARESVADIHGKLDKRIEDLKKNILTIDNMKVEKSVRKD
jgi:hypothetical protein